LRASSPRFVIPPQRRLRPRDFIVPVLGHALLVLGLLQAYKGWKSGEIQQALGFVVDIPAGSIVAVSVPPPPAPAAEPRPLIAERPGVPDAGALPVVTDAAAPPQPQGEAGGVPGGVAGGRPGGILGIGPYAGDSRLWVRPMFIPEGGGRPIQMDSVVRGRLLAMAAIADSLAVLDSLGYRTNPYAPASWVFTRNGQQYGMDSQWFYLGPIRIPTAILALVPMPNYGNYDQARANQRLMQMRGEILRAAARSEAEDDFRRAVEQIRERRDRERREQRERQPSERDRTNDRDRPIN
jgi:hypothetical protein